MRDRPSPERGLTRWRRYTDWPLIVLAVVALLASAAACQSTADDDAGQLGVVSRTEPSAASTSSASVSTTPSPTTAAPTISPAALTSDPPATTAAPGSVLALDLLEMVLVENEHQDGYVRDAFGYPADLNGDGCDTRSEVLLRDSITPATTDGGCAVLAGEWHSLYDNTTWADPSAVQIDHVVALKEAWDSGAWSWDPARLAAFGNDLEDPRTLRVSTSQVNESKGNADPSNWLPANEDFVCQFLADWLAIKVRWSLSMDQSEHGRIGNLLEQRCPQQMVAPWPHTAPPTPTTTTTLPPMTTIAVVTTTTTAIQPLLPPIPDTNCDASYPDVCIPPAPPDLDCGDVSFRRFRVVAPDPHGFDGDSDGVGCESG